MYYDNLVSRLEQILESNPENKDTQEHLAELKQAKLILLDAEQAEIFMNSSYPLKYYPHFIFDKIFVNFTQPVEHKWKSASIVKEEGAFHAELGARYQGILITKAELANYLGIRIAVKQLANTDKEQWKRSLGATGAIDTTAATEPISGAATHWYHSLDKNNLEVAQMRTIIDPATFPQPANPYFHLRAPTFDPEKIELLDATELNTTMFKATVNILYFLSCENVSIRYHEPKDSKEVLKKLGQKTHKPFYTVVFKRGGDRTKSYDTGKGGSHSFRYDVQGHPRHLVDECYHRNPDGTYKVIWIDKHQRGLRNELYVPAIRDATKVPKTFPE